MIVSDMRENGYLFLFRWNVDFFAVLMLVCLYCLLLLKVTNKGVNCAFLKGCIDVVLHKNTSIAPNEVTKYFYYIKWHAIETLVSLSNGNLSAGNPLDSKGKTSVMCDAKKVRLKFSEKCLNLIFGWKNYVQYGNICFPHLGILWKYENITKILFAAWEYLLSPVCNTWLEQFNYPSSSEKLLHTFHQTHNWGKRESPLFSCCWCWTGSSN